MLKFIFNKDDILFFEKNASSRGAPQKHDAKFRFANSSLRNPAIP